ncbi:Cyclin-B1-4, partial [Mucuna pruriens]
MHYGHPDVFDRIFHITRGGIRKASRVNDFVCIPDNAYVSEQVLMMEKTILRKLEWYLTVSIPYIFLVWSYNADGGFLAGVMKIIHLLGV